MKIVIWVVCVFVMALVQTAFADSGIQLGAIPIVALLLIVNGIYRALCQKVDEKADK